MFGDAWSTHMDKFHLLTLHTFTPFPADYTVENNRPTKKKRANSQCQARTTEKLMSTQEGSETDGQGFSESSWDGKRCFAPGEHLGRVTLRLSVCLPLWTAEIKASGNLEQSQDSEICPSSLQRSTATRRYEPTGLHAIMTAVLQVGERGESLKEEKQGQHRRLRFGDQFYLL